ncbi:MAG: phosphoenolpyruvate--protein phosphotransferase [Thermofilum sp. ex4484_82]|nr:MAG: phosphoenolpyruvate--protein phosphotransferase [Thermofilum sp. ex4484_82]OYT39076.1 MAG: phosphoenolpyruvate--protein phosphotransferase [Archaeoglobales archaeon ex4484_92]
MSSHGERMIKGKGIPASPGIVIGEAFLYKKMQVKYRENKESPVIELSRFNAALEETKKQIRELKEKALIEIGEEKAAIFDAHLMILEDPAFTSKVEKYIKEHQLSAEEAVMKATRDIAAIFEAMEDEYMKARAEDIKDLGNQIIDNLTGKPKKLSLSKPSIIVAKELLPSDTVKLQKDYVLGFVTELGGVTSHVSIIARAMGVPAVVAVTGITNLVKNGDLIIVNGYDGTIIVNPRRDLENGADGIGLLRTEFLIMGATAMPSEQIMAKELSKIISKLEDKPVIVRVFDIGGDKPIPCMELPKELNPFLGLRGIRLLLSRKDLFMLQLKAILRNSVKDNVKIMFPMVSLVEEIVEARKIVDSIAEELKSEGVDVGKYEIGMMVETPSAAIMADAFIDYVDFLSIGTNDLTQYTLAVDRTNEHVASLFDHLHPSILKLIKHVVKVAHEHNKWVGVCGEIASDVEAVPILVGLRVDELSVAPLFIPKIKALIRSINYKEAKELALEALKLKTAKDVRKISKAFLEQKVSIS